MRASRRMKRITNEFRAGSLGASVTRDSLVGIANRYGIDCPGIEFQWGGGRNFPPCGPPSLLYNGYRISFPGVKRSGRGVDHSPPSIAEVKVRVKL